MNGFPGAFILAAAGVPSCAVRRALATDQIWRTSLEAIATDSVA